MKLSFRWYGPHDPVTLKQIAQIPGMHSIVSAVYDTPAGDVWPRESIRAIADAAAAHRLVFDVVESVPVHEEIKLGSSQAPDLIDVYCENLPPGSARPVYAVSAIILCPFLTGCAVIWPARRRTVPTALLMMRQLFLR